MLRHVWLALGLSGAVLRGLCGAAEAVPDVLPGTDRLLLEGDIASQMVSGIDQFLLDEIAASVERRARHWSRDYSSPEAYARSIAANRAHLARIIGAVDQREPRVELELVGTLSQPALVGRGEGYEVYRVRWGVMRAVPHRGMLAEGGAGRFEMASPAWPLEPLADAAHGSYGIRVTGEGLLLVPTGREAIADVIALPDADQTPEMLAGVAPGLAAEGQFARRLAESGCRVVVPVLIDRDDTFSRAAGGARPTNQPHREFIYRQAFEMGRHVIGYEVQKVFALVDAMKQEAPARPVGIAGYGEGGLLALYAAAIDERIDGALVSGYFESRQNLWQEPIYRNVFALLDEFGDAELASMIAPRRLVVEHCRGPEVDGPPPPRDGRGGAAPGRLRTAAWESVAAECERARSLVEQGALRSGPQQSFLTLVSSQEGQGPPGSAAALQALLAALVPGAPLAEPGASPTALAPETNAAVRVKRQLDELVEFTQHLMREGEYSRRALWAKADRQSRSVERWQETTAEYRRFFYDEVIGRFDQPLRPPAVRTRKVYDEPAYAGYEVVMDVFPNVIAYGILLLPKDIEPGERRPVVVCQHGLEGRPQDVADIHHDNPAYHMFAARLAQRGFITYSPQNPYIFQDRFRTFNRKGNPLRKTLFSIIVPQHQQALNWLSSLPMVDPERIAFYGLSYGGKTAMRVPAIIEQYCLSICSADFNEWIWKNTSSRSSYSYVGSGEYEIFEFDLGNTFNYAEMAGLICPRPFMVERGHRDGVAPDEWVAYEFAKVRLLYADLKIPQRAEIEFFDGPHTINGVGTFEFLHKHLRWPKPE